MASGLRVVPIVLGSFVAGPVVTPVGARAEQEVR